MSLKIFSGDDKVESELWKILSCSDNRIGLIQVIQEINFLPDYAIKTEAYLAILCTDGLANVCINNQNYRVEKGSFIFCHPNMILESSMFSADFQFKGMVFTSEFVKEFEVYLDDGWNFLVYIDRNPVSQFNDHECEVFQSYWNLLYVKLSGDRLKHHKEVITSLLMALVYELRDSTERYPSNDEPRYRSSDKLFKRFMELLTSSFPKRRDVGYYAEQLCVTPKYLSAVCKNTVGDTASEIITKYVVTDIKYLLRQRDLTIKEVAMKLGFDNISFFGKYTRRNLGMSPKAYRMGGTEEPKK